MGWGACGGGGRWTDRRTLLNSNAGHTKDKRVLFCMSSFLSGVPYTKSSTLKASKATKQTVLV